ncbi:MAG: hypothetical protein P8R54_19340 [Myxococcota bacterium]|nr:hypothetical protein [Myxococcota bacterium]
MFQLTSQDRSLYEDGTLSAEGLSSAFKRRDPRMAEYLVKLVILDPAPAGFLDAVKEKKPNYFKFLRELTGQDWTRRIDAKDPTLPGQPGYSRRHRTTVIAEQHGETWKELEHADRLEILPDRLGVWSVIEQLYADPSAWSRSALLAIIESVPLKWGPWRALKRIYKAAMLDQDWEIFAALIVRCDREVSRGDIRSDLSLRAPLVPNDDNVLESLYVSWGNKPVSTRSFYWNDSRSRARDVSVRTLEYLLRRTQRFLLELARAQPTAFAPIATEILIRYSSNSRCNQAWLMEDKELWVHSISPLMRIVELSANNRILEFAFSILESRFREQLKVADSAWITRLALSERRTSRRMAVRWFLEPLCGHEQGRFHEVGLQRAVVAFLDYNDETSSGDERWSSWSEQRWHRSWNSDAGDTMWPVLARQFALDYIKGSYAVIASALPLEKVLWLLRNKNQAYRDVGEFLLYPGEGDSPYGDQLTLSVWTELLEDSTTFDFAARAIRTKFSGVQLTAAWYAERLLSTHSAVRELATSLLRDETKFRADDDWRSFHMTIARSHKAQADILQRSLYQLSRKDDDGHADIDDLPATFFRALLTHPSCHTSVIDWVDGGRVPLAHLSTAFLRELSAKAEWEEHGWESFLEEERIEAHEKLGYLSAVGTAARRWLINEASLSDLGVDWALARVERFESSYNFVRDLFRRDVTFSQLAAEGGTSTDGVHAILDKIIAQKDASSTQANFYKKFLLLRHPLARRDTDPNLPPLSDDLTLPRTALTFARFSEMSADERAPIRALAMTLGRYEMARWTETEPLSFSTLKPLVRDAFHDVRQYIVTAMTNPRRPESRIDVSLETFETADLYTWCFDARRDLRELGMQVILQLPERFGQPAQLLQLSESRDRRVRELVISVIWRQFRALEVTSGWKPNEKSVVPQSLSLAASQRVVALAGAPPTGMKPSDVKKTRKYLGSGVAESVDVQITAREVFRDFVRAVLFQIPPVRQSPKLPARDKPLRGAWRDKRTLIIAVRDLSLRDQDFAAFVLPILKEFQNVRGRMVQEACLAALAHIHVAHPELNALGDVA